MYWFSVCDLGLIRGCMLSTIININRPDGTTYSQTVYVPKYSLHAFCNNNNSLHACVALSEIFIFIGFVHSILKIFISVFVMIKHGVT